MCTPQVRAPWWPVPTLSPAQDIKEQDAQKSPWHFSLHKSKVWGEGHLLQPKISLETD
jgi:hypothetical protein